MIDLKNNLCWLCWCVLTRVYNGCRFFFSWQTVKRRLHRSVLTIKIPPNTAAMNLLSRAAQRLATWTKGPWERRWDDTKLETIPITCSFEKGKGVGAGFSTSLPRGIPLPRAQVRPMTLATNVLKVRYSFRTTPLRIVFISGIPEPGWAWWREKKWWAKKNQLRRERGTRTREEEGGEGNKWTREGGSRWSEKPTEIHMHIM